MLFDLKAIFGDKDTITLDELTKATAGAKFIDLEDGEYISKVKFTKAETDAKEAKAAATAAKAELETVRAEIDGEDGTAGKFKVLEQRLEETEKARAAAETRATRKEREALVAEKVTSPKLRRLLLMDAEALLDDDTDFETALVAAIEADVDYAPAEPADDDDDVAPVLIKTGSHTGGKPPKEDKLIAAINKGFGTAATEVKE